MIWTESSLVIAIKIGIDLDLFSHIEEEPVDSTHLAKATGADPALLRRLLRMLGACGVVEVAGTDVYSQAVFSASLKDPDGIRNGVLYYYDRSIVRLAKSPDYFKEISYREPHDFDHPAWEYITGYTSVFPDRCENPQVKVHFHKMLAALRKSRGRWPLDYAVLDHLLQCVDPSKPFVVDIGGGNGIDITHLFEALPEEKRDVRLVLQDLPEVIEEVSKVKSVPSQIELMAHDFLKRQPTSACGARAYFLHTIIPDWPNREAQTILSHLKAAMTPGYSSVLMFDMIMPDRISDTQPLAAAMDIQMMTLISAAVRTETQLRDLAAKVGLEVRRTWKPQGGDGARVFELQ